jgi:Pectate lyase superfamily protein
MTYTAGQSGHVDVHNQIASAVSATVPVARGGTGLTAAGANGQVLTVNSSGVPAWMNAVAGGWVNAVTAYGADPSGGSDSTTAIQAALSSFGTLAAFSSGTGGVVYLPAGTYQTTKPLIIPSGVTLAGAGPLVTVILLATGSNCDVIQWSTYNSSAQATILGVSAGSIGNAFYAGVRDLGIHGDAFHTTVVGYHHGINITMNPLNSAAGSDYDFDPDPLISNVIIEACTGDGFYHAGRSGGLLHRVISEYNNGNGFTPSYDTTMLDCLAAFNGVAGFYMNHYSDTGSGCKSYNSGGQSTFPNSAGQSAQWISGHSYSPGYTVMSAGILYFCILATSGSTAPASDATHWTAQSATSPAAWGDGFYWDASAGEQAWAAVDSQQNSASSYYLNSCYTVNIQGASDNPNYNGGSNPNHYAAVKFISCQNCNVSLTCSRMNSLAYIYDFDKNYYNNQLIGCSDGTETAMFPTGNGGVFTIWNGSPTFLVNIPLVLNNVQARSYQNVGGANSITQGSGAPTNPTGSNPVAGDVYFRTDTPSTSNQRIYICTVGGGSPTWVGIT